MVESTVWSCPGGVVTLSLADCGSKQFYYTEVHRVGFVYPQDVFGNKLHVCQADSCAQGDSVLNKVAERDRPTGV